MNVIRDSTNLITVAEYRHGYYKFKVMYQGLVRTVSNSRSVLQSKKIASGNIHWGLRYTTTNIQCDCPETDIYCDVSIEIIFFKYDHDEEKIFKLSMLDRSGRRIMSAYQCTSYDNAQLTTNQYLMGDLAVVDGFFFVECKISEIYSDSKNVYSLSDHLGNLLKSGEKTDATIEVKGESFHVHKSILGARSPFFKAVLSGTMTEAQSGSITIEGVDKEVFRHMLHYIYTDTLDLDPQIISIYMAQHLFVAADKYCIDGLKRKCEEILCNGMSICSVLSSLSLAEIYNVGKLKSTSLKFASELRNYLKLVITDEYQELRENFPDLEALISKQAKYNFMELFGSPEGANLVEN